MHALKVRQDELDPREGRDHPLLLVPETLRARFFATANARRQKHLGQFLTPPHVADLMAGMFSLHTSHIRLLDAGAGMGILSAAFIQRQLQKPAPPHQIEVVAYEVDGALIDGLNATYAACQSACQQKGVRFSYTIHNADFIAEAVELTRGDFFSQTAMPFDAAIVNPPYGKLSTLSEGYRLLHSVGAETTNFYTAFLNLIIGLLRPEGELVAITPRSFCNGPYFKPFRQRLLREMSLRRIHVFESRTSAFKHDNVLQENVILHAVKAAPPSPTVIVSESSGAAGDSIHSRVLQASDVVSPCDAEAFIHIPVSEQHLVARGLLACLPASLRQLGLTVSTGRVVEFRARKHIRQDPEAGALPLIYPCHFSGLYVAWPKAKGRKPNAIREADETQTLLIPAGVYVVIKRFTSKEERRRIVACIYDPARVDSPRVGFENHLNYIHADGKGIDMLLAKGLWAYLNSSALDLYFRQFNGHTQVNATDLRNMRFPTERQLRAIGRRIDDKGMGQDEVDQVVTREIEA